MISFLPLVKLIKFMIGQPLLDRRDYALDGMDQLEKNKRSLYGLPDHLQKQGILNMSFDQRIDKIAEEILNEKSSSVTPGWGGTAKAMKKHKEITNPFALTNWMASKDKGDVWGNGGKLKKKPKSHYKEDKKKSSCDEERIASIVKDILANE